MPKSIFSDDIEYWIDFFARQIRRRGMPGSLHDIRRQLHSVLGEPDVYRKLREHPSQRRAIVHNKAWDLYRAECRWRQPIRAVKNDRAGCLALGCQQQLSAQQQLERISDLRRLNEAIEKVARRSGLGAQSLVLYYLAGLSHKEAANMVDCKVGTMRRRVSAARKYLSEELRHEPGLQPRTAGATRARRSKSEPRAKRAQSA